MYFIVILFFVFLLIFFYFTGVSILRSNLKITIFIAVPINHPCKSCNLLAFVFMIPFKFLAGAFVTQFVSVLVQLCDPVVSDQCLWVQVQLMLTSSPAVRGKVSLQPEHSDGFPLGTTPAFSNQCVDHHRMKEIFLRTALNTSLMNYIFFICRPALRWRMLFQQGARPLWVQSSPGWVQALSHWLCFVNLSLYIGWIANF